MHWRSPGEGCICKGELGGAAHAAHTACSRGLVPCQVQGSGFRFCLLVEGSLARFPSSGSRVSAAKTVSGLHQTLDFQAPQEASATLSGACSSCGQPNCGLIPQDPSCSESGLRSAPPPPRAVWPWQIPKPLWASVSCQVSAAAWGCDAHHWGGNTVERRQKCKAAWTGVGRCSSGRPGVGLVAGRAPAVQAGLCPRIGSSDSHDRKKLVSMAGGVQEGGISGRSPRCPAQPGEWSEGRREQAREAGNEGGRGGLSAAPGGAARVIALPTGCSVLLCSLARSASSRSPELAKPGITQTLSWFPGTAVVLREC